MAGITVIIFNIYYISKTDEIYKKVLGEGR